MTCSKSILTGNSAGTQGEVTGGENLSGSPSSHHIELHNMPPSSPFITNLDRLTFTVENPMRPSQQTSSPLSLPPPPSPSISFHPFFERCALLAQFIISLISFGAALAYNQPNSPLLPVSFKYGEAKLLIVLIGNTLHLKKQDRDCTSD